MKNAHNADPPRFNITSGLVKKSFIENAKGAGTKKGEGVKGIKKSKQKAPPGINQGV